MDVVIDDSNEGVADVPEDADAISVLVGIVWVDGRRVGHDTSNLKTAKLEIF